MKSSLDELISQIPDEDLQCQNATEDKLDKANRLTREFVDLKREISNIELDLETKKEEFRKLQFETLPDFFLENRIDHIGVDNFIVRIKDYCFANIAMDKPNRNECLKYAESIGFGDTIKTVYVIEFGKGELENTANFESIMNKYNIVYNKKASIHHMTLTKMVKEKIKKVGKDKLNLDLLGATVGNKAEIEEK